MDHHQLDWWTVRSIPANSLITLVDQMHQQTIKYYQWNLLPTILVYHQLQVHQRTVPSTPENSYKCTNDQFIIWSSLILVCLCYLCLINHCCGIRPLQDMLFDMHNYYSSSCWAAMIYHGSSFYTLSKPNYFLLNNLWQKLVLSTFYACRLVTV